MSWYTEANKIDSFSGDNRWLSNFWPAPVTLDGVTYPSVEHAYQAAKTLDPETRKTFVTLTAGQAKRAGANIQKSQLLRPDWATAKFTVMEDLVRQKFNIPEMQQKLIATGTAPIEEGNTWGDTVWGTCKGVGENRLGKLLMQIRSSLLGHSQDTPEEPIVQEQIKPTQNPADIDIGDYSDPTQ